MDTLGKTKTTIKVGLTVGLSLGAIVGLVGCGEEADGISGSDLAAVVGGNGLSANGLSANGLSGNGLSGNGLSGNGLTKTNGLSGNGLSGNGLSANGLSVQNGLSANGLLTNSGFMTTDMGRKVVAYLAKCALASNDSFTKQDQYGTSYTFPGSLGLCPAWKNGSIASDRGCMNRVSACIMAHVNTAGVHIPIWIDSEYSSVGWGVDLTNYPFQEGTFFGNIFASGDLGSIGMSGITGPAAYFCDGNGFAAGSAGVVAGRLGKGSTNAPYVNPFGDGVLCNSKGAGHWTYGTNGQPGPDGFQQICANGYCFQAGEPITVWRANTYTPVFDDQYIYRLSPMSATGSSIDIANSATTNGTAVQQYASWDGDPQRFYIRKDSSGRYAIKMRLNTNKCIGPKGNGTANGTYMEVQDCNNSSNQAWTVTANATNGGFTFKNVASGTCLDVTGKSTANGARMELYTCNGATNQQFKIQAL
jgi:hypothetical protein